MGYVKDVAAHKVEFTKDAARIKIDFEQMVLYFLNSKKGKSKANLKAVIKNMSNLLDYY